MTNAYSLVGAAVVVLLASAGGYYAGSQSGSDVTIGPNQTIVDRSEALSEKNGLAESREGSNGNTTFDCSNESCDVSVDVDGWHEYRMLYAFAYKDGDRIADTYLHPGDEQHTFENLPADAYVELAIPVTEDVGYIWSQTYWLEFQSAGDGQATLAFDADAVTVLVNEDYFFGEAPESQNTTEAEP